MLAISLHAVHDDLRDELVPLNKKYPSPNCSTPAAPIRVFPMRAHYFEYVMLKDVNDTDADARELVRLLAGIPAKINLSRSIRGPAALMCVPMGPH